MQKGVDNVAKLLVFKIAVHCLDSCILDEEKAGRFYRQKEFQNYVFFKT